MPSFFSRFKNKPYAGRQAIPSNPSGKVQNADKHDNEPLVQVVFSTAAQANFEEDIILHLGTEGISERVTTQIGIKDASGANIRRGFYGAGSPTLAKEIAEINLRRQIALDAMRMDLERERLRLQPRHLLRMPEAVSVSHQLIGADKSHRARLEC